MSKVLIAICGKNASGKTTMSRKLCGALGLNHINGDDLMMFIKQNIAYYRDLDLSYPNDKYDTIKKFKIDYRNNLTKILLKQGQSVVFDASGYLRKYRDQYLEAYRNDESVKIIIIWADLSEKEHLARLHARDADGGKWHEQLVEREHDFEPPEPDEADVILRYDQKNYQEIEDRVREQL